MTTISVNGRAYDVDAAPDMPLLLVLRDVIQLRGTKYGCGIAQCGACTVHLDGQPTRACQIRLDSIGNAKITTIEGANDRVGNAVRTAWRSLDVVQCGYCQSGQMMSAIALLSSTPHPTDADIDAAMDGNICRCGTYGRIRKAIHTAANSLG